MPEPIYKSVDEYIASQPEDAKEVLERARSTIRKAVPKVEEVISYKMPTFKASDGVVLYLAAWKKHYSLYSATGRLLAALKSDLAPYKVNKSTIRFSLSEPVPVDFIPRIARFRAAEVAARTKPKLAKPKLAKRSKHYLRASSRDGRCLVRAPLLILRIAALIYNGFR
jgi:uncharacterized protein YdhG (YjbR/CyaY superfamily)